MLGEAFQEVAGQLIPWIALSALLMGFKLFYFDLAFQLGLRTDLQIWAVAGAALLSIVLNLWWIPLLGIMGAVYATVAASALALIVSLMLGRRSFFMPFPTSEVRRIALASFFMAIVLWLAPDGSTWIGLITLSALGAAAYMVAIWYMDVGGIRGGLTNAVRRIVSARRQNDLRFR
jgi:O-antigen/teichoic acid export membrane protein